MGETAEGQTTAGDRDGAIEAAWRIHGAVAEWTGKVDAKASFALALESAIIAGIVTLSGGKHALSGLEGGWQVGLYWVGNALLIIGVLAVMRVVSPRLRGDKIRDEYKKNFIYFGHLQHWKPNDLSQALLEQDILPMLSTQIVNMSEIAWQKHRWLQISLVLATVGTALVALASYLRVT